MKLLALVLLLSAFSSLTLAEVVDSFIPSCLSFFIKNPENPSDIIVPTIFSGRYYKTICQRWKNQYRFATVYDTEKRIPVYSAYTFLKKVTTKEDLWNIEPQLENIEEYKDKKEMMDSPKDEETVRKITHQAVDSDYKGRIYTRGHVYPCSYTADQDQADSTYTLTNSAPQTQKSNSEWAEQVETPMLKLIQGSCSLDQRDHKAYIVTGVVPGKKWMSIIRDQEYDEGINVPSHFWSAFCCYSKTDIKKLIGKAYIAEQENFNVRQPTIDALNEQLTELYGQNFRVFPGLPVEDIKSEMNLQFIPSFILSFITFLYNFASELQFSI